MKLIFLLGIIISGLSVKAQQNFKLVTDSLTNKSSRIWVSCNDTILKLTDSACLRGKQYIFLKAGKTGVRKSCVDGKWVKNNFSWSIEKIDNEYLVRVINAGGLADNFQIQVIKDVTNNTIRTRLTLRNYDRKEVERFCYKNK